MRVLTCQYSNRQNTHAWLSQPSRWVKGYVLPATAPGYITPSGPHADGPMMRMKNGGFIPAAFDPTDPSTYTGPVYFS